MTVAELLERWECVPEGEVLHGGVGLVVPVRRAAGGAPGVIKVSFPHPGNVHEPDAFTVWGGHGAVLLHERDDARYAMLLERAGASSLAEVSDGDEVAEVAGLLSHRLAVPAPPGLPLLRDRAMRLGGATAQGRGRGAAHAARPHAGRRPGDRTGGGTVPALPP